MGTKKTKVKLNIEHLFYILFCFIAIICVFVNSFMYLQKLNFPYSKVFLLGSVSFICVLFYIPRLLNRVKYSFKNNFLYLPLCLFLLSLSIRIIVLLYIGIETNQISDFLRAYQTAMGEIPFSNSHFLTFSNWGMFVGYLHVFKLLFSSNIFFMLLGNAFLNALSVVLIYYLVNISLSRKIALLASWLYIFEPMTLVYQNLLTPEYIYITFSLLGILIIAIIYKYSLVAWKRNFLSIAAGCIIAFSGFFKSLDKVALIAIGIMFVLFSITHIKKYKMVWKQIAICGILLVSGYVVTRQICYSALDFAFGSKVNRDPSMHYIYLGMSPMGQGIWSEQLLIYSLLVDENNYDYKKADDILKNKLFTELQEYGQSYDFFKQKILITWSSNAFTGFSINTMSNKTKIDIQIMNYYNQIYYIICCFFLCVSAIHAFFVHKNNRLLLFCGINIVGFFFLLLLSEAQARYKIVIYPYMLILSAHGITIFYSFLSTKFQNVYFSTKRGNHEKSVISEN